MSTKRERLLDWIRNGDPDDVPVLLGLNNFEVASAKLGRDQTDVTMDEAIEVAEETGTHLINCIGMPLPFDAIPFLDDVDIKRDQETLANGTIRHTHCVTTPEGILTEIIEKPEGVPAAHTKFYVQGEEDFPAFVSLVRKTTQAVVDDPAIRRSLTERYAASRELSRGQFPTMLWPFVACLELICSIYMDQVTAVYFLYDHKELMEELMDRHWEMTKVWLEMGEKLDVDIYGYAINGYEWLSPDIYHQYMIPQARKLNDVVAAQGKLSWLHTCGKMKNIAAEGAYQQMAVSVLESLSTPPTGDIDNMRKTREQIGHDIVTRGGVNCELFYDDDLSVLRERTEYVLDSVKGYRHILGDTNPSYPSYPWENTKAVIDVVRERGCLFE